MSHGVSLQTSQEQRHQNMEIHNPSEAALVCLLLEVMQPQLSGKTVGVVTPYQRQKFYLEEKLSRLKSKMNISINTIDGFQVCDGVFLVQMSGGEA